MKILLLSNKVPYPANDGSSIAIKSIVDGLLQSGAEVHLLSINTLKHFKKEEDTALVKPEKLHFHSVTANTNVSLLPALTNLIGGKPYHVSRFKLPEFEKKLRELLRENFDIVQLEGLPMAVYIDFIRQHSDARISLRAHNVEFMIWQRQIISDKNLFRKLYLREQIKRLKAFEIRTLGQIDFLIPITNKDLDTFKKLGYKGQACTVPCGIDLTAMKPSDNTFESDIAYVASFDWLPNLSGMEWYVEEVWPLILSQRPSTTMRLAGRHIPSRFNDLVNKGIQVIGEVDSASDFISSGKLVIVPLLAGSGMRIKIVENMALGKAIVSTTIGAEGIATKNGENIILANAPADFARAVVNILENEELRSQLQNNARATAENFYNNIALGKQLLRFYQHN